MDSAGYAVAAVAAWRAGLSGPILKLPRAVCRELPHPATLCDAVRDEQTGPLGFLKMAATYDVEELEAIAGE